MSYSEFTFQSLRDKLALHLMQDTSLFAHIEEVTISEYLQITLQENVALALNINTEKARSEMIIAPMLIEVRKILKKQPSQDQNQARTRLAAQTNRCGARDLPSRSAPRTARPL